MDREAIQQLAHNAMAGRKTSDHRETGYIYHHGLRVAALSLELAEIVDPDRRVGRDLLWAGALLHDLGKGNEPHHEIGGTVARQLLADLLPDPQVQTIARIIAEHNQRDRPETCLPASRIVQDADTLDHFGPQGVWLVLGQAHRQEASPAMAVRSQHGPRAGNLRGWCSQNLNFEASRKALARRIAEEMQFFEALARSQAGRL